MARNVGGHDRIARLALGTALLVVGIVGVALGSASGLTLAPGPLLQLAVTGLVLLLGAILVVTGALKQCPVYERLGIDTAYVQRT